MIRPPQGDDGANVEPRVLEAVKRVVEAFDRSDWSEIDVSSNGVRVQLLAGIAPLAREHDAPAPVPPPIARELDVPAGAHLVTSPSPGIFWRSPEPGAPPFADVGQLVGPSDTVCIVEVMKLMNHLKAGVAGTVVAVFGENGVAVAKGEPLFAIAPGEAGA